MKYLFLTFLLLFTTILYSQDSTFYPLSKGTKWTYKGNVRWQVPDNPKVFDSTITLEVKVIDVFRGDNFFAAELDGSLDELSFYSPGSKHKKQIIISADNYYYLESDLFTISFGSQNADSVMKKIKSSVNLPADIIYTAEIIMKKPLNLYDSIAVNNDPKLTYDYPYKWYVNGMDNTYIKNIEGVDPKLKVNVYELTYQTNPDITIIDFAPGIGIINYLYEHFGSTSTVNMKLVEFVK